MKKIMLCLLLLLVYQPSYSMDFLKNLFGSRQELSKEEKRLQELVRLKKSMLSFGQQVVNAPAVDRGQLLKYRFLDEMGTYSHRKTADGIQFAIEKDESGVMRFTAQNLFNRSVIIDKLILDKKLFEDSEYDRLYSALVSYFDSVFCMKNHHNAPGFLDDYTDEKFITEHPETVANLQPKYIAKKCSVSAMWDLKEAIETMVEGKK